MLRRDLIGVTAKPGTRGCVILGGSLSDPYTGTFIIFQRGQGTSDAIQIDHLVALSDAWQKGAQQLTEAQRIDFANDPINLLAVDGPTNRQKGDGDAATWLPPKTSYRCEYVSKQIAVKAKYGLWVTEAEKLAMIGVLTSPGCGVQVETAEPDPTYEEPHNLLPSRIALQPTMLPLTNKFQLRPKLQCNTSRIALKPTMLGAMTFLLLTLRTDRHLMVTRTE